MSYLDNPPSPVKQTASQSSRIDYFWARCQARCYLFGCGVYELAETVDELQRCAEKSGLIKDIGQDAVQAMMARAISPYWEEL